MSPTKFLHIRVNSTLVGLKLRLAGFPRILAAARNIRMMLNADERTVRRLQRDQHERLLQPSATTRPDRHPALFTFVQQRLGGKADIRILSFGCSTGEEPLSLSSYLPDAKIDAVDINPRSIGEARRNAARQGNRSINFLVADRPPAVVEFYDAVFCLSVLRHSGLNAEQPETCTDIMPFSKFESAIAAIDRTIRPGGILLIWASNFQFADSAVAMRYRPLDVPGMRPHRGAFYGPDDIRLEHGVADTFAFEKLR